MKQLKNQMSGSFIIIALFLAACTTPTAITPQSKQVKTPENWLARTDDNHKQHTDSESISPNSWLEGFNDKGLIVMVDYALMNNYALKAQNAAVAIAKQAANISNASDYPELSLSLQGSRDKRVVEKNNLYSTDTQLMLQLSYEVDLWGKLSAEQKKSRLDYASQAAQYQQNEVDLVANISKAWFHLIEAEQLLRLFEQRAKNLQHNLDIIQASYRLGINQALDVYLAKNDVNSELARVAEQNKIRLSRSRDLELLLGNYPAGSLVAGKKLPIFDTSIPVGIPSDLLTQRADIRASWYALLATDAELAVAYKQRFPGFVLSASGGDSSKKLENFLTGGALVWSLVGSVTAPIFNAGRLKSLEEQARLSVVKKEQEYLEKVYHAFSEVEEAISAHTSFEDRYYYYQRAKENALSAEKLSFDQYMSGLVSYATVLESQRRAFDAQTMVIQLTNQLLQNRISLYLALGGEFDRKSADADYEVIKNIDGDDVDRMEEG